MQLKFYFAFVVIMFMIACGNNKQPDKSTTEAVEESRFYPFPQYLASQLDYIDSMPLAIEMVQKIDGNTTDSGFMPKKEFRDQMAPFLAIDPNDASLKEKYTETSFHDLSLKAITFSITSNQPELPLRRAYILLDDETRKMRNIILNMTISNQDSTIDLRMLWYHNRSCIVSEIIEFPKGKMYTRGVRYKWDDPPKKN